MCGFAAHLPHLEGIDTAHHGEAGDVHPHARLDEQDRGEASWTMRSITLARVRHQPSFITARA
jgi:hypothetical protein